MTESTHTKKRKKPFWKWIKLAWVVFGLLFTVWMWVSLQSRSIPSEMYRSNESVIFVDEPGSLRFESTDTIKAIVLFFPGGMVDPEAYIPLARAIATDGYIVHIIKMPMRMSTMGYTKIKELFDLNDPSLTYILGGHSQGGKMAAQFVYENPGLIDALFMLGTSHPRDFDMSGNDIPAIKISAEHDGRAGLEKVQENAPLLPANTQMVTITGGNHSHFGYMGHLLMDDAATISREEQHRQTIDHLLRFFNELRD